MQNILTKVNEIPKKGIIIAFSSLLIFALTFLPTIHIISTGLDPSWMYAVNYFFEHNIILGRDHYFTFGPLSILAFPIFLGENAKIALVFWGIIKFSACFLLLHLVWNSNHQKHFVYKLTLILTSLAFFSMIDNFDLLLFLNITLLLTSISSSRPFLYTSIAILITNIAFLIKPGEGLICASPIMSFFAIMLSKREYKQIIINFIFAVITLLLLWKFVTGSFAGIINYFITAKEFISGNSSAMAINPDNNWLALAGSLILLLSVGWLFKDRPLLQADGKILFILLLFPLYLNFKYGMDREDGHIQALGFFLLYAFLYMMLFVNNFKKLFIIFVLMILALQLFHVDSSKINSHFRPRPNFNGLESIYHYYFNYNATAMEAQKQAQQAFAPLVFSNKTLKILHSGTNDVYPVNLTILPANNLLWQTRPIFQSYASYTPKLDQINADFFANHKSADYLIWTELDMLSIDNRYLLNDEPLSIYQILNWYKPIAEEKDNIILKKQNHPQLTSPQIIQQSKITWDQWISVPKNKYAIIRAEIQIQRNLLGGLKRWIYKEGDINIYYQLANGKVIIHRLPPDNAISGVWISPYLKNLTHKKNSKTFLDNFNHYKVEAIKIVAADKCLYKDIMNVNWQGINYKKID